MSRFLIFRLGGRRAVSTIIGGLIMLSLLLTALGTMVFVSQQNDQYQQSSNKMAQYDRQQDSENLVANPPGLQYNPNYGGCSGCTMYNMSLSNLGGVGVQIVRIYINSTGSGCIYLCVLNPTLAPTASSYGFNQASQFINAGETSHAVLLYLPSSALPLPSSSFSKNTVRIISSRGSVFSFQWPFQLLMGGQSQSAFSAGIMKVAYQYSQGPGTGGYDSSNEPGLNGGGGTNYCHQEPAQAYQAGATYAERLNVNYTGVTGGALWFVSPWVAQTIFNSAQTNGPAPTGHPTWPSNLTTVYLYVNITNVGNTPLAIAGGSIDLFWGSYNWLSANLIGFYEGAPPGTFYPASSAHTIAVGHSFYAIYKVISLSLGTATGTNTWPPPTGQSVMFLGSASLTSNTNNGAFIAGVSLMSGLWVRYSC
jgi:hypothetical protein